MIAQELYLHGGTARDAWRRITDRATFRVPDLGVLSTPDPPAAPTPDRATMGTVIVDAAWYVDGRRTLEMDSIEKLAAERGGPGSGGSGCGCRPTTSSTPARDAFELPELAIADARHKHDRPKVERHGDCLLTVVPTARYVDDREEVEFGELFLYAGRDYLLSVRYGHAAPLAGVRHVPRGAPRAPGAGPGRGPAGRAAARRASPTTR